MTKPPVTGATHTLPFDKLSPRDFERLSLWLVEREGYERAEHLGAAGNEQGRDLIAWLEGQQWAFQCKRVKSFGPADAEHEVGKLKKLPEEERPFGLIFIVTCDVSAEARKRARRRCAEIGLKKCGFWADTELDQKVKRHAEIVREFFQVGAPEAEPEDLFTIPFIRNPDFVGREEDLERLHQTLHDETPVGIRPAGLTGMGGIGKTQLAVEYAYRYRDGYPGGVLWINAAEPLARGFAALGRRLRPDTADRSQEEQVRAAGSYLGEHADALLVFDNLADPATLNRQVIGDVIPAALPCRVLFSTRRRDLGRFTPVEVTVLPEDAALQLLLRHPDRKPARDPAHAEHDQARAVCRLLGRLPLALEVAGAFLGEWPEVRLADFRARLRQEGALATLDEESGDLPQASLPLIHDAAVAATLQTQWDALEDKDACLLLRVAGQLPEAAQIPVARLGLLAGVPGKGRPGHPSRLARSLKRLERASLVEELQETQIRLHPLVREFAARQMAEEETVEFRGWCAANLAAAYEEFAALQDQCARRGIDALQGDLLSALDLLPTNLQDSMEDMRSRLQGVLRLLQREAQNLRGWVPEQHPGFFAQQVLYRAESHHLAPLVTGATAYLTERAIPFLDQRWRASSESPALERMLTGHKSSVLAVAVTPDGRLAVSASFDCTLRVWDLESGQQSAVLRGHKNWVRGVALTPDGQRAVSAAEDRTLRVWDLESGRPLAVLRGHEDGVRAVAVTPDGRRAISTSYDRTLRVWDLVCADGTGQALAVLRGHEARVNAVVVTPDGRCAVLASDDGTLRVWDISGDLDTDLQDACAQDTGQELAVLRGHKRGVNAVAVTADGQRAVSASDDRTLRVWDLASACALGSGQELAVLEGHTSSVRAVAVTPDGRRAVSASDDGTVRVWDLACADGTGQALVVLRGHGGAVQGLALTPDGRRAVSAADDRMLGVWDLSGSLDTGPADRKPLVVPQGHDGRVNAVAVMPDGRLAVSASSDRTLRVWNVATGQVIAHLMGHESSVDAVAVTPDGRRAVSASWFGTLRVWDISGALEPSPEAACAKDTGQALAVLQGHQSRVFAVVVTPDGRRAVSASYDRTLLVWDLAPGQDSTNRKPLAVLPGHESSVLAVAVTPDGRRAVSGSWDGALRVWDLERACAEGTGQELAALQAHEEGVRAVAVTADGQHAISASDDRTLRVWDISGSFDRGLASCKPLATLGGHEDIVRAVAVTPDMQRAVSVSDDRTLRVWDMSGSLNTGLDNVKTLAKIALDGVLWSVSLASDGVTIVTGDAAGNVYCLRYVEPTDPG